MASKYICVFLRTLIQNILSKIHEQHGKSLPEKKRLMRFRRGGRKDQPRRKLK